MKINLYMHGNMLYMSVKIVQQIKQAEVINTIILFHAMYSPQITLSLTSLE